MPAKKGHKKVGGRKRGTPNKVTAAAKEAFAMAFDGLGGVPELVRWGRLNRTEFYKLYSKLIPIDVTTDGDKLPTLVINVPALPNGEPHT